MTDRHAAEAAMSADRADFDGRRRRALAVGWLVGVLVLVLAPAAAQAGPTLHRADSTGPAAVPGEIVVGFRSGVDASERALARSAADVSAERNLLLRGGQLVKVESGQSVQEAITELEKRPDVRYAEPNWIYRSDATTPNDPRFGNLWGLDNTGQAVNGQSAGTADDDIDAPEAWDRFRGSASTVVAVVDSGVAWDHPDLSPNMWSNPGEVPGNSVDDDGNGKVDDVRGWDFVDRDNNPWDYDDHGTHVAGTIAARGNNGVGITGVAWQASIMPLRVLDAFGLGTNADIADAFTYAADKGARVVNASLGGAFNSRAVSDAIGTHPNTLYVIAAGNDGQDNETTPAYPCNNTWANVICVAATDNTDTLGSFSNYGASSVDLAAPGVNIDSTRPHYTDSFTDGFETSLGNWTVQSGPWGRSSVIGSVWLTDSPGANYADNADWAIRTTSKVDVGARSDCMLRFDYGTFLGREDWLYVQSSTDAATWSDLGRIGNTGGVVDQAFYTLGAGGSRYYRFRLTSDDSGNDSGVFVDNVRIACPGGTYGAGDYKFLNGTSMAAPQVAGAATVLFNKTPAATVGDVKAALLNSGDTVAGLSGKTVSGRRLNLDAALTAVGHRADAVTTITSRDPSPSPAHQPVTVKYTVTGVAGTPTGDVTVTDGSNSCTGTVAAGQCTITFPSPGTRALVASYSGDSNYSPGASASVSHVVGRSLTTTAISSDAPDPSNLGQAVTVRYSVTGAGGTPTGLVRVSDGVNTCQASVAEGSCNINLVTVGARKLRATYAGDSSFEGSTSAEEPHTVSGIGTVTAITGDDPDPSVVGQAVTVKYKVTGNVPGGGAPSGNVTVTDGSRSCTGTVAAGECAITFTTAGAKSLTASYVGDFLYGPSTSAAVSHQVDPADTTATITSHAPDPSNVGQAVTVDFAVAPVAPGSGTPTGDVVVSDGVDSCAATVGAGRCTITLTTVGPRSLTARYAGDSDFNPSESPAEPHTVRQPPSPGGSPPPATSPAGTGGPPPAAAPPAPPPAAPPATPAPAQISGASQTNPRFRISAKRRLAQVSRRRSPVGTTFTYTLNTAATVRFDFTQTGRTVNGKCVAVNKRNKRKPACVLQRGSLTFAGHAGLNTVRFAGWLSRTKKLTPGKYTLTMTAVTPGAGATSQQLRFTVVR